jgi:hypothetical protein
MDMSSKQTTEAIMLIVNFFLGVLLLLIVLNGGLNSFMIIGALTSTYIFVHYWEKRYRK